MGNVLAGVVMQDTEVASSYLDVRLLAMIAASFIPLAVSFLTKKTASDGLRAVVNIVGSGIVSVLSIWINPTNQPVTVWLILNTFLAAFLASIVAYKGLWKPTGVTGTITEKSANIGFGSPPTLQTADKGAENEAQVDVEEEVPAPMPDPSLTTEETQLDVPKEGFYEPSDLNFEGEEFTGALPEYEDDKVADFSDLPVEEAGK